MVNNENNKKIITALMLKTGNRLIVWVLGLALAAVSVCLLLFGGFSGPVGATSPFQPVKMCQLKPVYSKPRTSLLKGHPFSFPRPFPDNSGIYLSPLSHPLCLFSCQT